MTARAGTSSVVTPISTYQNAAERRDHVSWLRLLWVGPLTVVVALLVNLAIAAILRALK